ncbi:carbohydrate binding family 9 domain-containing protein [Adhaeribacter swui]|uniref:Carbohydrate binding family 9 domain-containing protein n=1 Tax=Adhaeribacter swui TaxID=2086471 RepID=A0A7G7G896_9BACT|nr:carbohydrate binding family 9 domain-containing protein [Adhaeribacter swui]QNF33380.1 carbohydrate binding family 9 domain-containing protein [Adhaeribacter swui]
MRIPLLALFSLLLSLPLFAQKKNAAYQLPIKEASSEIKIDGVLDELAWQEAAVAKDFYMMLPMDTSYAQVPTEVRMTYDKNNIYIIATNYVTIPGPYMVESLRRDWSFLKNDNFIFFIDPFDDQTNGFAFGANAAGAQWDGIMYEGSKVDLSWDNKWVSAVKNYDDKWIFEAAIPFKTIRYKKGITNWGINFGRQDLKSTEKSAWAPVPRQFPSAALAYTGTLAWDQPPPEAGTNISLIPYALGGLFRNIAGGQKTEYRKEVGIDAKVAITSSLNLDLTVNPDFSQVDVDQQVTNLDRFELFFPERRQFFLENGDLFTNYGYTNIRPFFSRRIGLGVPIKFGARLSGRLSKNWRLGVMDMQTGEVDELGLPAQNFAVASLQRRVFARSYIGVLFINKESLNYNPGAEPTKPVYSRYNRNIGFEYNLASANNVWTGKAMVLKSFSPGKSGRDWVHAANLQYASRAWLINWQHQYVGQNYTAEVGYVPRQGFIQASPKVSYSFFPKKGPILNHGPTVSTNHITDEKIKTTDNTSLVSYGFTFRSRSTFNIWTAYDFVKLLSPFDPTNFQGDTLARRSNHSWKSWGTEFVSKPQSIFTYSFTTRYGGYYADGTRLNLTGSLGYRFQPFVSLAVAANYNDIKLPEPWGRNKFWLIGPRLDVTMTNTLYLTTFVQYNEQIKNVNLNARLQWRYKPASDLFIVYTDNYLPTHLTVKSRALVVKFTYWWNL